MLAIGTLNLGPDGADIVELQKCGKPYGRALRGVTQQQQKPTVQNRDKMPSEKTLDQYEKRGTGASNRLLAKIERGFW